jgi:long-chain fatty acid transport protein
LFEPNLGDGQVDLRLHGWGAGFRLGALLEHGEHTRIGITYRSAVDFSLAGTATAANISAAMAAVMPPVPSSGIPLSLPQGANVSLYREVNRKLALLADAGWTNWRHLGQDRHWRDTWRAGLGLRWRATSRTMLHTGASFDSAPVSDAYRTPDLPIDHQLRFAGGVTRNLNRSLAVSLTGTYTNLGTANIQSWLSPLAGRLSGKYASARLPFVSLSFLFRPAGEQGLTR